MTRRGAAPLAGIAASGFDFTSVVPIPAAVPDSWVAATVKAVAPLAAGGGPATAGAASASVAVLVQVVLRSMLMMKLKTIAICLLFDRPGGRRRDRGGAPGRPEPAGTGGIPGAARDRQGPERRPDDRSGPEGRSSPPSTSLENYVIEPPDMILVEVLEALPGRPISGERLVRPDGKISLGFYGEIYVAGLTIPEAKEKIVLHLRKFISDEILGLIDHDPDTAGPKRDSDGQLILKDPEGHRPRLRGRHGLQQQELLRPGGGHDPRQAPDHRA